MAEIFRHVKGMSIAADSSSISFDGPVALVYGSPTHGQFSPAKYGESV
jgi:hypothetical protein